MGAILAGAMLFSVAGIVRGSHALQHAHHLAGLLFGCAYAQYSPAMSKPHGSAWAASKDAAQLEGAG